VGHIVVRVPFLLVKFADVSALTFGLITRSPERISPELREEPPNDQKRGKG
jgi:hypothetical protein